MLRTMPGSGYAKVPLTATAACFETRIPTTSKHVPQTEPWVTQGCHSYGLGGTRSQRVGIPQYWGCRCSPINANLASTTRILVGQQRRASGLSADLPTDSPNARLGGSGRRALEADGREALNWSARNRPCSSRFARRSASCDGAHRISPGVLSESPPARAESGARRRAPPRRSIRDAGQAVTT
jgi:hypothetical protein